MKLATAFGHSPSTFKYEPSKAWVLPTCRVGLEWEWENCTSLPMEMLGDKLVYLAVKTDGSLRDNGVEFVTKGDGLFGQDLVGSIDEMLNIVTTPALGRRPTCGYRTAFHVHLDIRDMEGEEVHNLLFLYALLEQPIFNFVGKDRENSNFCVPWFRADGILDVFKSIAKADNIVVTRLKKMQRYSATNANAIAKFGTLEFRQMENDITELKTKQMEFINLVMCLKRQAQHLFSMGLHGEELYAWAKRITQDELIRSLAPPVRLPTTRWDYVEALTLAGQMVEFKKKPLSTFVDALFVPFYGTHPNWR